MAFQLTEVVPWGRYFEEYVAMFMLSEKDLQGSILGCADGPASFNCELTKKGGNVVSVDPLYAFSVSQIRDRIEENFDEVMVQTFKNMEEFVWEQIPSVEALGRARMAAMHRFLSDYDCGKSEGRYCPESLPLLSFADNRFNLALCSHFLFFYSDGLDLQFHIKAIDEMCRVASEVRISPLLQLGSRPSPHAPMVVSYFKNAGYDVEILRVPYAFQRGGNKMLQIRRAEPQNSG